MLNKCFFITKSLQDNVVLQSKTFVDFFVFENFVTYGAFTKQFDFSISRSNDDTHSFSIAVEFQNIENFKFFIFATLKEKNLSKFDDENGTFYEINQNAFGFSTIKNNAEISSGVDQSDFV